MPELIWMPEKEKTSYITCRNLTNGSSVFRYNNIFYLSLLERTGDGATALNLDDYRIYFFDFDTSVEVVGHLKSLVIDKVGD